MSDRSTKVAALAAALRDLNMRDHAAMELEKMGPDAANAVPDLIRVIQQIDHDEYCPNPFVRALGAIGPEAKPAIPALMAALEYAHENWDWYTCRDAAEALGKVGARDAVPLIRRLLDPEDPQLVEMCRRFADDEATLKMLLPQREEAEHAAREALARLE